MWHVGIDLGGTHLDCVAINQEGMSAESHQLIHPEWDEETVIPELVCDFLRDFSLNKKDVAEVAVSWKHGRDKTRVLNIIRQFAKLRLRAEVFWNVEAAFNAAIPDKIGIMVLSGMGSAVYVRTSGGRQYHRGGWSAVIEEPGSSFFIGQQAILAALRAKEADGPKTKLVTIIPDYLKATLEDITIMADSKVNEALIKISSLSQLVLNTADDGDIEAIKIRDRAISGLASLINSAVNAWPEDSPKLSYSGSLMCRNQKFRGAVLKAIKSEFPDIVWSDPKYKPAYGAILSAAPKFLSILAKSEVGLVRRK